MILIVTLDVQVLWSMGLVGRPQTIQTVPLAEGEGGSELYCGHVTHCVPPSGHNACPY